MQCNKKRLIIGDDFYLRADLHAGKRETGKEN